MEQVTSSETRVQSTPTTHKKVERTRNVSIPEGYKEKKVIFRSYQVIWYILGFIETVLAFRTLFRLFAANPRSPFVALIYSLSAPFSAPFRGIFGTPALGGSVFEFSTVVGMIVYVILAWGIMKLLQLIKPVEPEEVQEGVDQV